MIWIVLGKVWAAYALTRDVDVGVVLSLAIELADEVAVRVDDVEVEEEVDDDEDDDVDDDGAAKGRGLKGDAAQACAYVANNGSEGWATRQGSSWNSKQ